MDATINLTRSLLKHCDDTITAVQALITASRTRLVDAETRHLIGQQLGILLAHKTILQSPAASDGLHYRLLDIIAEDIQDVIRTSTTINHAIHHPADAPSHRSQP